MPKNDDINMKILEVLEKDGLKNVTSISFSFQVGAAPMIAVTMLASDDLSEKLVEVVKDYELREKKR